jgi:hypothetical protein
VAQPVVGVLDAPHKHAIDMLGDMGAAALVHICRSGGGGVEGGVHTSCSTSRAATGWGRRLHMRCDTAYSGNVAVQAAAHA